MARWKYTESRASAYRRRQRRARIVRELLITAGLIIAAIPLGLLLGIALAP